LASAKECVTTHLPNQSALKMDGTRARGLYSTMSINIRQTVFVGSKLIELLTYRLLLISTVRESEH
jgi:hypothetical protein